MSFILEDGTGKGFKAKITKDNQISTFAVTTSEEHHENEDNQKAWTGSFDAINPTSNDDYFVNMKNSSTAVRVISRIEITSTVAGYLEIQKVTGTSIGGVADEVNSWTIGGPDLDSFTFESSVDITGLTDAGVLRFRWLRADITEVIDFPQTIRLLQNAQVALLWTVSTGILTGNIDFYEEG